MVDVFRVFKWHFLAMFATLKGVLNDGYSIYFHLNLEIRHYQVWRFVPFFRVTNDVAIAYVSRPAIVNKIDHVTQCWPVSKRVIPDGESDLSWPKVQKYCLISPSSAYTDFHVDFGGTSVWYHVHKGEKIFWFIPPTKKNFELFQKWTMGGSQDQEFFGEQVEDCQRIRMKAGETLFIPSGWIHAVYSPIDCINFGGNFLHGLSMTMQVGPLYY